MPDLRGSEKGFLQGDQRKDPLIPRSTFNFVLLRRDWWMRGLPRSRRQVGVIFPFAPDRGGVPDLVGDLYGGPDIDQAETMPL